MIIGWLFLVIGVSIALCIKGLFNVIASRDPEYKRWKEFHRH